MAIESDFHNHVVFSQRKKLWKKKTIFLYLIILLKNKKLNVIKMNQKLVFFKII